MNRIYTKEYISGGKGKTFKNILVTWTDRKCNQCKRFLKKTQTSICSKCAKNNRILSGRVGITKFLSTEEGKEYNRLHGYVVYHIEELEVGDYV